MRALRRCFGPVLGQSLALALAGIVTGVVIAALTRTLAKWTPENAWGPLQYRLQYLSQNF